ncbi:acyl carrier protein [Streptomyces niveus]|uniref:acyl carrier protein n=1 Tax=Streptomyces niveus TaxID=193462 RepID=UPI0036CE8CFF
MSEETDAVVARVIAKVTGRTPEECRRAGALLERDLNVDSLALLEVVETLQERLTITVPDEVTARVRTVADLQDAVGHQATTSARTNPEDTRT